MENKKIKFNLKREELFSKTLYYLSFLCLGASIMELLLYYKGYLNPSFNVELDVFVGLLLSLNLYLAGYIFEKKYARISKN